MIHPSYNELSEAINAECDVKDSPLVASRYSVCLATAKRAKQLIAGAEPLVEAKSNKPLSIAVDELYQGKVKVLGEEETEETFNDFEDGYYIDDSQS